VPGSLSVSADCTILLGDWCGNIFLCVINKQSTSVKFGTLMDKLIIYTAV